MEKKLKEISKNDIQLFLLGELEGGKRDKIQQIISCEKSSLKNKSEIAIKETFEQLLEIDNFLGEAAKNSFEMPKELEKKIIAFEQNKPSKSKDKKTNVLSGILNLFKSLNYLSLAGGAATASFCFMIVLQIDPALLMDPSLIKSENAPIYRSINFGDEKEIKNSCSVDGSLSWEVTENILYQIPLCSFEGSKTNLENGATVSVGDKFSIAILPLEDVSLRVVYKTERGTDQPLISSVNIKKGEIYNFPLSNDTGALEFAEPKGKDIISFYSNSRKVSEVQFVVE